MELANFQEALSDLTQALIWNPTVVDYYRWRGEAYNGLRIYTQAIFDFDQVITRDPIPTAADYHGLGFARFKNEDYFLAIDDFTKAIVLEPTRDRFELRGASYFGSAGDILTDQLLSAISDFDQAIRLGPTGSIYQQRGDTYAKLGLNSLAEKDWAQACVLDLARC